MKKTLLVGSFGAKNLGDEMILQAALKKHSPAIVATADANFSQNFSNTNFKTIPSFPTGIKSGIKFLCSLTTWHKYKKVRKQVKKILFPGGGLFKNNLKAVWIWTMNVLWVKMLFPNKKVFFEAQGIDQLNNFFAQKLTLWSFNQAHAVSVRDKTSKKNLEKLGYTKNIKVVDDAAHEFLKKNIEPNPSKKNKQILIQAAKNFNAEKLRNQIEKRFPNHQITFVAFDALDINVISQNTNLPKEKILFPKTYQELIDIFNESQVFIGQRFHFLILAHLFAPNRTFLLHKPYAPKTKILAKKLGLKRF